MINHSLRAACVCVCVYSKKNDPIRCIFFAQETLSEKHYSVLCIQQPYLRSLVSSLLLWVAIYIYIYIYMCVCVCVCMRVSTECYYPTIVNDNNDNINLYLYVRLKEYLWVVVDLKYFYLLIRSTYVNYCFFYFFVLIIKQRQVRPLLLYLSDLSIKEVILLGLAHK